MKFLLNKKFIAAEFVILCLCLPTYIIVSKSAAFMFNFLWGAALYSAFILYTCYKPYFHSSWKWQAVNFENMRSILVRWAFACVAMTVFIWIYDPERMFGLLKVRPEFVPVLLVAYPVFSALPQELIFCTFFFKRYEAFFGNGMKMVSASALIFAYAHILYINPVAPTLSLVGGIIFALTYLRTQSLALVTIEHGLYGNFLFLIGLGWYFYGGSVQ